jgi:hypothetical protein
VGVVTHFSRPAPHFTKSWKWRARLSFLILASAAIPSRVAVADSRSSLVFVSVRVVETCRVDAVGSQAGNGVDLKMLCNSAARPNVGLAGQSTAAPAQMSTTVTGARAVSTVSLTPTRSGADQQVLRIDF